MQVQHTLDSLASLTQMPANIFGERVESVDNKYVANFGEEVARGHSLYVSSGLLSKLQVWVVAGGVVAVLMCLVIVAPP